MINQKLLPLTLLAILPWPLTSMAANNDSEQTVTQEKIKQLEQRIEELEQTNEDTQDTVEQLQVDVSQQGNTKAANTFNPGIGVVLNGRFIDTSNNFQYDLPGAFHAADIGPGSNGLQLGESELNMSANVDDKFFASSTISFGEGSDVEEAFLQTLDMGHGFNAKFGRFFSSIGYLASKHTHTDDFANRPLPYEQFLGGQFGDDGIQATWIAPTELYWESGAEFYRGDSFPAAGAAHGGKGVWTAFTHVGGDIGQTSSWRAGLSYLNAKVNQRPGDNSETFSGDSTLWIADFIYKWAPDGNRADREFKLQGEYLSRREDGRFTSGNPVDAEANYKGDGNGWYLEGVYRFARQWRVGLRTSRLKENVDPIALSSGTLFNPSSSPVRQHSVMVDWSNSEFSRIRLQYDNNDLNSTSGKNSDDVWVLQYIAAFGAHGAHSF